MRLSWLGAWMTGARRNTIGARWSLKSLRKVVLVGHIQLKHTIEAPQKDLSMTYVLPEDRSFGPSYCNGISWKMDAT
jgi:hypothetical protein